MTKKKLSNSKVAAGSAFIPYLRAIKSESDVRPVCHFLHFLLHRRDDVVALALVTRSSTAVRRARIYSHVEAIMPLLPPDAPPVLDTVTMSWALPPFVLPVLSE
jgi:hypothetical protein